MTTTAEGYALRLAADSDIREYLPLLHALVTLYPAARVLEIGTRDGNSTLALLAAARQVSGHVWSIDNDPSVPGRAEGMGRYADCPEWTFTCGDAISPDVAAAQPPTVEILFIDAGHSYAETLAELRIYQPRVAATGLTVLHDPFLAWDNYGVRRAVTDYAAENELPWIELPGRFGLVIMGQGHG
jgi:predicted O-methyltransferase YrrM